MKKKLVKQSCPQCHDSLDEVDDSILTEINAVARQSFEKGDLGMCQRCGTLLEFGDGLVLHVAPQQRLARFTDFEREAYERLTIRRRQELHFVN